MDRLAAMTSERDTCIGFCRQLTLDQWRADSAAPGWRVQDVVAHMGGIAHELFSPLMMFKMVTARSIERFNDQTVDRRKGRAPSDVLREYERWSRRLGRLLTVANKTPLGRAPFKLGEIGAYPMALLASAVVFDTHTHLRHDIAPAVNLEAPPTDDNRMAAVVEWMLAVMEKCHGDAMAWMDQPVGLTLNGAGGGTWRVDRAGGGRLRVRPGDPSGVVSHITGNSEDFPVWATRREPWRKHTVEITGEQDYGARFLDAMRIV